jgi:hypothetical protein
MQGAPAKAVVGRAVVGAIARHCSRRWRVDWGEGGECGRPDAR